MSSAGAEAARARRLERVKPVLACPQCKGPLTFSAAAATCGGCGRDYPIRDGRVYFLEVPQASDDLDRLKSRLKRRLGRAYYTIGINVFAPTYPLNFMRWVARFVDPRATIVVDAGSGNHRLHDDIICADLVDYEAVDIVCSLDVLPFRTAAVDAFVSRSVLEHVTHPAQVVDEFHRCTRPGGVGIHVIPFLFPFHASPADFGRFTHKGHDVLFARWEPVHRTNPTGPVTVLLLVVIEVLSIVLSFGVERIKAVVYLALCVLLFPLKLLDAPFVNRPSFVTVAASLLSVVRKPT